MAAHIEPQKFAQDLVEAARTDGVELIPGGLGDAGEWAAVMAQLASSFTVVADDPRGFSRSDKHTLRGSTDAVVASARSPRPNWADGSGAAGHRGTDHP
jgi:pimeloyl-ACP methyl ester carboxylesterase